MLIDTSGATVATYVLPANAHVGQSALVWWAKLVHHQLLGQIKRVFIDGGIRGEFVKKLAKLVQIKVTVPQEVVRQTGKFCVHATRWVVERSISWITNNRRLAKYYERKVLNEESFILLCNSRRIIRKCYLKQPLRSYLNWQHLRTRRMFAKVIHALAWHMVRSYSVENLRLALSQANVRATIHRQARLQ